MNFLTKKKLIIISGILLIIVSSFFIPTAMEKYNWHKNKKIIEAYAQGSSMSLIGLTDVQLQQCTISCNGGCCTGGQFQGCMALTTNDCPLSQEISGTMTGGSMSFVLEDTIDITTAGIKNGGQMIGGFMSSFMPSSPNNCMAGEAGCVGSCCSKGDSYGGR